jgi:hypothetical protein
VLSLNSSRCRQAFREASGSILLMHALRQLTHSQVGVAHAGPPAAVSHRRAQHKSSQSPGTVFSSTPRAPATSKSWTIFPNAHGPVVGLPDLGRAPPALTGSMGVKCGIIGATMIAAAPIVRVPTASATFRNYRALSGLR